MVLQSRKYHSSTATPHLVDLLANSSEHAHLESYLEFLCVLLIYTGSTNTISTLSLLQAQTLIQLSIIFNSMNVLFENGISLHSLEFCLETIEGMAVGAAI